MFGAIAPKNDACRAADLDKTFYPVHQEISQQKGSLDE